VGSKGSLLKPLTVAELKEIAQRYGVSIPAGLKRQETVKYLAENLHVPDEELSAAVERFAYDKLVGKIRDAKDYFLTRQVTIDCCEADVTQARVGGYSLTIDHLGGDGFEYRCDSRCNDWLYQVQKGRYPFCKHYAAVIAELVFSGRLDPQTTAINHFSAELLEELMVLVDTRRKQEGLVATPGRGVEETLQCLREDFLKIACQDADLGRDKYHDTPERQFERMVGEAFELLEFDTIPRRREEGWDLLVSSSLAIPPYIMVIEAKTAASGTYDYIVRNPDYLIRLKSYCIDMVREKLLGTYKDYVRYLLLMAPDFPEEAAKLCRQFRHMTEGIKLAFVPAPVLLHLVERYRERPIVTHTAMERLFASEKVLSQADVDQLFTQADGELEVLVQDARRNLREKIQRVADKSADACFIKFDLPSLGIIFRDIVKALEEELLIIGKTAIGTETVHVKHDYHAIWREVLTALVDEFTDILKEESLLQERNTELKENIIRFLELQR
jgi:hypothetical protein